MNRNQINEKRQGMKPRRVDQLSGGAILAEFDSSIQSNADFFFDGRLVVEVDVIVQPECGAGQGLSLRTLTMDRKTILSRKNKSIILTNEYMDIGAKDCLAYGIVLGMFYHKRPFPKSKYDKTLFRISVKNEVKRLVEVTGIDLNHINGFAGMHEFGMYQKGIINYIPHTEVTPDGHLQRPSFVPQNYRLIIYNIHNEAIFVGNVADSQSNLRDIHLLLAENHVNVIKSVTGAFAYSYFCTSCHKGYSNRDSHKNCLYKCNYCFSSPPCANGVNETQDIQSCTLCNRNFFNLSCFKKHQISNVCEKIRYCNDCPKLITSNAKHDCNAFYCKICRKERPYQHQCFVPVYESPKKQRAHAYILFDFETIQESKVLLGDLYHTPNLCVSNIVCDACINISDDDFNCDECGERVQIFKRDPENSNAVVDNFLAYVFLKSQTFRITAIAHNAKSFDSIFILRRIFDTQKVKPFMIFTGTKVLLISLKNVRFIDSLNFVQAGLSKIPKMFALDCDIRKGNFPHLFNTTSNQSYIGPYPDIRFYEPDSMDESQKNDLIAWYATKVNATFDFQTELEIYCKQDVKILRLFVVKLALQAFTETTIAIFQESITIASFVSKVYRKQFYTPDSIAVIPKNGYRLADNQSLVGIKWLLYCEQKNHNGTEIQSAYRGREALITINGVRYKVDGYIEVTDPLTGSITKYVYEFLGCFYHYCPCQNRVVATNDDLVNDVLGVLNREAAERKIKILRENGYTVTVMWECEWHKLLRRDRSIKSAFSGISKSKLEPRDAFFGGNTDLSSIYHKCKPNETIKYYDFCSLYPYINRRGVNVSRHPKVIIGNDCMNRDLKSFFGLLLARILPPKKLFHPIVPVKLNNKLIFTLCYKCAENFSPDDCSHSDLERSWIGTYVSEEIKFALEYGYKVTEIREMWEYESTDNLFASYVTKYQIEKLYASGFPDGFDETNIDEFIAEYDKAEGVKLDRTRFVANKAWRTFIKFMLNSLWGFFGQRCKQTTVALSKATEFFKLLNNPLVEIRGTKIINDRVLLVSYDDHNAPPINTANVVIAAFTTAVARVKLNAALQKCGKSARYWDSDSVFFVEEKSAVTPTLETGNLLGDFTNELVEFGSNAYIDELVVAGPKSYGYKVVETDSGNPHFVCKVKGITLNVRNSSIINFDSLKSQVLANGTLDPLHIEDRLFVRDNDCSIRTVKRRKQFKPTVSKRRLVGFRTYPYGYILSEDERIG